MTALIDPAPLPGTTAASLTCGYPEDEDYLRLHFNESPYGPPPGVSQALLPELLGRCSQYPDAASERMRNVIADFLNVTPDMVLAGNGVDELIMHTCLALGRSGGAAAIAVTDQTFPGYLGSARMAGADVRTVAMRGYSIPVAGLAEALRAGADAAFVCNPHNPTGALLDKAEVTALADAAEEGGAVAIFDEAYIEFAGPEAEFALAALRSGRRLMIMRTFSKAWGLAGLRLGYAVGPADLIDRVAGVQRCVPFNVNRLAQAAAAAALHQPDHVASVRQRTAQARDRLCRAMPAMGVGCLPSAANFVLLQLPADSATVAGRLQEDHKVLVRDTGPFGLPGCIRVTIGTEEQVDRFTGALGAVLAQGAGTSGLVPAPVLAGKPLTGSPVGGDEPVPASAISPAPLFNGYIGMHVIYALHEVGVLQALHAGETSIAELGRNLHRGRLEALLRVLALLGYAVIDGAEVRLTALGDELVRKQGYVTWCVGGYGPLWASLAGLTDGSLRYGHDVRRNETGAAVGSGEADAFMLRPIQDEMCASIEFQAVADIGCGDGTRLLRMCQGDRRRRGIGIDISKPACALAEKRVADEGLQNQVEIIQADILSLLGKRKFPGIELVMSIFMLHDLLASATDHGDMIRALSETFPDARYFLLADTATQPAYPAHEPLPIFSLGFELAHSFMDVELHTREEYEATFEKGGLRLLKCVPFGAPATWLFLLERG